VLRIPDKIAEKAKAVVGALGLVATVTAEVIADDVVDAGEVGTLVTVLLTAGASVYAIWRVGNRAEVKWAYTSRGVEVTVNGDTRVVYTPETGPTAGR
jgi:hypothetical protein